MHEGGGGGDNVGGGMVKFWTGVAKIGWMKAGELAETLNIPTE